MSDAPKLKSLGTRYTELQYAASGGMSWVYLAQMDGVRPVALKILKPGHSVERFGREGQIRIQGHDNLMEIYDSGEAGGYHYIAMERLPEPTLAQYLQKCPGRRIPWELAVDFAVQLCAGLGHLHAQRLVHRDLKPDNIKTHQSSDRLLLKIIDFGIVRRVEGHGPTQTGDVLGTYGYFAPEQSAGEKVDLRADVFALGVCLYEMLVGEPAFGFDRRDVEFKPAPAIRAQVESVPRMLDQIVRKCLAKSPWARYQTMSELAAHLESVRADEPHDTYEEPRDDPLYWGQPAAVPGEQRLVVTLVAVGIKDEERLHQVVSAHGGELQLVRERRAAAVFGKRRWEGDELARAADAAQESRRFASAMAIAAGHATDRGRVIDGDVVRRADAACKARVGGVAVDADTAKLLTTTHLLERRGEHFLLLGRSSLTPARQETVGAELEIRRMRQAFADLRAPDPRAAVWFIVGAPGAGKSQLMAETRSIAENVIGLDGIILQARAALVGGGRPFALLAELFKDRAAGLQRLGAVSGLGPERNPDERWQTLRFVLEEAMRDGKRVAWHAEYLADLLGIPTDATEHLERARTDQRYQQSCLSSAFEAWLDELIAGRPVALLLDDVHWADTISLEVIGRVLARNTAARALVVAAARPDDDVTNAQTLEQIPVEFSRIQMRGLSFEATRKLVAARVKGASSEFVQRLHKDTEGNPLFMIHVLDSLDPRRLGARDLDDQDSLPLSTNAEGAVRSRIDRLPAGARELCPRVAPWRERFSADEAKALSGIQRGSVHKDIKSMLDDLVGARILEARADDHYEFRSQLVREAAYQMLDQELAQDLHGRAAQCLQAREPTQQNAEEIALHFELAKVDKAHIGDWYGRALTAATARGDGPAVVRTARKLIDDHKGGLDVRLTLIKTLQFQGKRDALEAEIRAAWALAQRPEHITQQIQLLNEWSQLLRTQGDLQGAEDKAGEALALGATEDLPDLLVVSHGMRANALIDRACFVQAEEALLVAHKLARGPLLRGRVAGWMVQHAAKRCDLGARLSASQEAVRCHEESGDERRAVSAAIGLADFENRVGNYQAAIDQLTPLVKRAKDVGNRTAEGYGYLNLGFARTKLGQLDEAGKELSRADPLSHNPGDIDLQAYVALYATRLALAQGDKARGLDIVEKGLRLPLKGKSNLEAMLLTLKAVTQLALGRPSSALKSAVAAMEIRDERAGLVKAKVADEVVSSGLEEEEATLFLVLANAQRGVGQDDEAAKTLANGRRWLFAMADKISNPVHRAGFLERVQEHRELVEGPRARAPKKVRAQGPIGGGTLSPEDSGQSLSPKSTRSRKRSTK